MTMLDTLFGMIPAASLGQQWLAEELQLVNWGGYDGAHRLKFSPAATLLCGGSGSGKSTLMDAYIALMMPHTTPFNGASNGGVSGRARGGEQRNILSYGRGKLDEARTGEGTQVRVLRGDGADTWTAVAMTWVNHDRSRFTAVRAWYIPASARTLEEVTKVRAVCEGAFGLGGLEQAAAQRLTDAAVRAVGLETIATDREFSARLHTVLGIGAAGSGAKAMGLLARIQAGQQITTVDELYKRMVLEEPETLAAADAVVSHFDELEATRQRMLTAQRQVRALSPIRDFRVRLEEAAERLRLIGQIGGFADPGSLATLWRNRRRLVLLRAAETELRDRKASLDAEVSTQEGLAQAAGAERDALAEVVRSSGGARLENAERELAQVVRRLAEVRAARERFDEATACLGEPVGSRQDFVALQRRAGQAIADASARDTARRTHAKAVAATDSLRQRLEELEQEYRVSRERRGNIPTRLHECREQLARAAGLSPEELPFVGELIEVRTEYEPWREAFNLALGGFATTLLIDQAKLGGFRAAINTVRLPQRLRFEGVHTGHQPRPGFDPRRLPGRLDYADSVFTGWLQDRLESRFDYVCVDSASELGQHHKALTITGQLSQGSQGAHGGHGVTNVLGFSSQRRLDDLTSEIAAIRAQCERAEQAEREAEEGLDVLEAQRAAYARVAESSWELIDVAGVEAGQARWERVRSEVMEANPKIAELRRRIDELRAKETRLREATGRAKAKQEQVACRWGEITDQVDDAQRVLDEAAEAGRELSASQEDYLAGRFDAVESSQASSAEDELTRFDIAMEGAAQRMSEDRDAAQRALADQRENLRRSLESFLENWPNPSLRADPDTSVKDFERILEGLEASGLHELEAEWKNSLLKLSGNDLTNLNSTLDRSLREIQERIEPVNAILRDLPFYDDAHRLQITPRDNQSQARRRFRKELREVRAQIEAARTDTERAEAYTRMSRLIGRIRRSAPDFAELIDVRNHVRVSAERIHAVTRQHVSLYDHIGEKSGGESQELVAFIVGAALRYQLGDADAERPRYAPVFLDEALIKADAHFTKRAIGAWRGLGFQLIIGAPNDKYSAIEPHVEMEYDILKDTEGRSWARPKAALAEQPG